MRILVSSVAFCIALTNILANDSKQFSGCSSEIGGSDVCPTSPVRVTSKQAAAACVDGEDCTVGYLNAAVQAPGYNWWNDPTQKHSFHFFNLDHIYDAEYHGMDHVTSSVVEAYALHALDN
mmetsp:Transcript_52087/g.122211  ORF Transcript_52087/g.122211 Transcript_52087/m.122211 type:complete len:121 (+) Transcript_52087:266-628(+)|eukprot:2663351-Rhodomonas_salina.2